MTINIESCQATEVSFDTSFVFSGTCDSIIIIQTIPLPKDFIEIDETTCKLENIGLETSIWMNVYGCDSIIVTNTLYDPPVPLIESAETCVQSEIGSDTSFIYSGICDSIIITNTALIAENELFLFEKTCDLLVPANDTLFLQSAQGCDSIVVTEYFNDPISFDVGLDFDPCDTSPNGSIDIQNLAGGSPPFSYSIDGMDFTTNALFMNVDFGNYNVQVIDGDGCLSDTESITLSSNPEIEIELPQQITLTHGQDGQILVAFNTVPDTFYWSIPSVLSCEQCLNPVISTTESMTLTLFAINESGCISSRSIDIIVKEDSVYIPNIFSPNGDGVNDEFKIFTSDFNSNVKTMRIFNRWGNLLFEKLDFQTNEDVYWNGYYNNEPLNSGVFVYYIELELSNGESIIFIGDVTLIR